MLRRRGDGCANPLGKLMNEVTPPKLDRDWLITCIIAVSVPVGTIVAVFWFQWSASPVVQGNVGSESAMRAWSFWVEAFSILVITNLLWILGHVVFLGLLSWRFEDHERLAAILLGLIGLGLCLLSTAMLLSTAPRA